MIVSHYCSPLVYKVFLWCGLPEAYSVDMKTEVASRFIGWILIIVKQSILVAPGMTTTLYEAVFFFIRAKIEKNFPKICEDYLLYSNLHCLPFCLSPRLFETFIDSFCS